MNLSRCKWRRTKAYILWTRLCGRSQIANQTLEKQRKQIDVHSCELEHVLYEEHVLDMSKGKNSSLDVQGFDMHFI
jgi:hypothetical protein